MPEVEFAAAKALWLLKNSRGKEALLAVLEGKQRARSNAFRREFRKLKRSFSTPKGTMFLAFNYAIGFLPVPGVGVGYAALEELFGEKGFSSRASVAILLAKNSDPATRQALIDALTDRDWSVRAGAVQAIAMRNQPDLQSRVVPLFSDRTTGFVTEPLRHISGFPILGHAAQSNYGFNRRETKVSLRIKVIFYRSSTIALLCLLSPILGSCSQTDVQTIIERSVAANDKDYEAAPLYSYKERDREPGGSKTFEVDMLDGSPYRRLIAVNSKLLSAEENKQEQQQFDNTVAQRRAESPEDRLARAS